MSLTKFFSLTEINRATIEYSGVYSNLSIKDMQRKDSGNYTLTVSNTRGKNTYQVKVKVLGEFY